MNGVHDLGGMHGFGPIVREENEPLFHAEWEAHVCAMTNLAGHRGHGYFNIDQFRHGIERMAPAEYLRATYWERWLASLERNLIEQGLITHEELQARTTSLGAGRAASSRTAYQVAAASPPAPVAEGSSPPVPRFTLGDAVLTRIVHPRGHTRLPRYARGKRGVINLSHGPQTLPDANAHGLGPQPQPLYSVRFAGRELWGESAEPHQVVYLDLWESYLEPAPA